jgi:hypothetical protein
LQQILHGGDTFHRHIQLGHFLDGESSPFDRMATVVIEQKPNLR